MGGRPDNLKVEKLEIVYTGDTFGDPPMDVIDIDPSGSGGDPFDLLVHFRWEELAGSFWATEEAVSESPAGPLPATANFYAESIGPGEDLDLGNNTVDLVIGGDMTINTGPNNSDYQVRLAVADANVPFQDANGNNLPGLYRIGCTVSFTGISGVNTADAYYQKDLDIRVAERQPRPRH